MQRDISIHRPSTTLNPLKDASGVESVDFGTQFDGLVKKADNLQNFVEKGEAEGGLLCLSSWFSFTALSRTNQGYY